VTWIREKQRWEMQYESIKNTSKPSESVEKGFKRLLDSLQRHRNKGKTRMATGPPGSQGGPKRKGDRDGSGGGAPPGPGGAGPSVPSPSGGSSHPPANNAETSAGPSAGSHAPLEGTTGAAAAAAGGEEQPQGSGLFRLASQTNDHPRAAANEPPHCDETISPLSNQTVRIEREAGRAAVEPPEGGMAAKIHPPPIAIPPPRTPHASGPATPSPNDHPQPAHRFPAPIPRKPVAASKRRPVPPPHTADKHRPSPPRGGAQSDRHPSPPGSSRQSHDPSVGSPRHDSHTKKDKDKDEQEHEHAPPSKPRKQRIESDSDDDGGHRGKGKGHRQGAAKRRGRGGRQRALSSLDGEEMDDATAEAVRIKKHKGVCWNRKCQRWAVSYKVNRDGAGKKTQVKYFGLKQWGTVQNAYNEAVRFKLSLPYGGGSTSKKGGGSTNPANTSKKPATKKSRKLTKNRDYDEQPSPSSKRDKHQQGEEDDEESEWESSSSSSSEEEEEEEEEGEGDEDDEEGSDEAEGSGEGDGEGEGDTSLEDSSEKGPQKKKTKTGGKEERTTGGQDADMAT